MLQKPAWVRGRLFSLLLLSVAAAGCSILAGTRKPQKDPLPRAASIPVAFIMEEASARFALGRAAALAGDFPCAYEHFQSALEEVRPEGAPSTTDPELLAFSFELYESILRYQALAGPSEEAGNVDGKVAPELDTLPSAAPSEEAIVFARESVTTDLPGVTYDIPIVINEPVLRLLAAFQDKFSDVISRGLARSGRYIAMIHRIFEEEGLPRDLAQIALIESSFITHARSPMRAHGIWQFMPGTGRQYGLSSNAIVDERSDPEKSTRAAARHLSYLYELFKDWHLAMAAYNAGEGKILRALQRTSARDFWDLAASGAIRPQTENYVPAVIAATLIAHNPVHYGFAVEYEPPLEYETVNLDRPIHLRHLCDGDGISLEELARLNPELRTAITPREPQGYELKVPLGSREQILLAFAAAPTATFPVARRHMVRKGETLSRIARRYRVSVTALASANSLSKRSRLARGRVLVIPGRSVVLVASAKKSKRSRSGEARIASGKTRRGPAPRKATSYRVRGGDTLYRIALKHGTTVARILAVNSLSGKKTIRPGDRLKIPARSR